MRAAIQARDGDVDPTTYEALDALGILLGHANLRCASRRALYAMLKRAERPLAFTSDQEACHAHGASGTCFRTWRKAFRSLPFASTEEAW